MSYGNYIFQVPQNTPDLTFAELAAWTTKGRDKMSRKIGTTVEVGWYDEGESVYFELYDTIIARLMPAEIYFPVTGDAHMATTQWLSMIARDNGLGGVWRIPRHTDDLPGPIAARGRAGLLTLDGDRDKPVEGHTYPVSAAQADRNRAYLKETSR
jgi:hypothetical protein